MNPTDPRFRDLSPSQALAPVPARSRSTTGAGTDSAATRAYRLQLTRVSKLQSQLAELDVLAQAHRQGMQQRVHPLQVEHRQQLRAMAELIDQRLAGKSLTAPQRQAAVDILCGMAATLAREGDQAMAALHDRHSPQSLKDMQRLRGQTARAELEAALGESLDDLPVDAGPEQVMAAAMARLQAQREHEAQEKQEKAERRRAKKQARTGAVPSRTDVQQQDASALLRALFRQLASALHPDRETDDGLRARKTQLMGEANAAYARKDLVALMRLQQDASLADPLHATQLADDKLASMTLLLKQQVAELERERAARQDALAHEFQVPRGLGVTSKTLQIVLLEREEELELALDFMRADFQRVQGDAGFKRWLNEQRRASERLARHGMPRGDYFE
jgi:hypothetical protein